MLRLWRDILRVVIMPERLVLVRTSRWRAQVLHQRVIDVPAAGPADWRGTLNALVQASREAMWRHTDVRVVLSNRLVRFLAAPALDATSAKLDLQLIANHYFKEAYGAIAASWACRLDQAGAGIATAIDGALLEAITQCFGAPDYRLASIQPALVLAFNRLRGAFGTQPQWFAMSETGHACVCLFQGGAWLQVRAVDAVDDLALEVMRSMAREQILAGVSAAPERLAVLSLDGKAIELQPMEGCTLQRLSFPSTRGQQSQSAAVALALAV